MKKRLFTLLLAMLMVVSMFAGCGSTADSGEAQAPAQEQPQAEKPAEVAEKVFNMAIADLPEVLNPADGTDSAMTYLLAMYERLYNVDADGNYHFYLAESCDVSEDGLTYTVKLRKDATWSDGTLITADDLLFTVAYYQTYVTSVVSTLTSGYTANKVDDHTVELVLESITGSFYDDLCWIRMIPSHVFDGNIDIVDGSEKLTGTGVVTSGPYTIAEWNSGESLILKAREDYYRGKAPIDKLNFIVMPDANAQKLAFENGELSALGISDVETYNKYNNENYNLVTFPAGKVVHLQYNPDGQQGQGLTDDERLAVELSLNREEIATAVYGNDVLASPAHSCFASTQAYFNADITHAQDIEKATALAESSGLKDKTITIIYNNFSAGSEGVAVVVQQQLAQIGVQAVVQGYDAAAFYPRAFHAAFGAFDTAEATDWDYAVGFDGGLYGDASSSMVTYSFMGLLGEAGSGLMLAAYSTADVAQREELFKQAQVATDASHYFPSLVETNVVIATQKNVVGADTIKISPFFADYWALDIK